MSFRLPKYSPYFQVPYIICLIGWMSFIPKLLCEIITCPLPDFPENGGFKPTRKVYDVGLKIEYICNSGSMHFFENNLWYSGKKTVDCISGGKWSREAPFCDIPIKLKNIVASSKESILMDGNKTTCAQAIKDTEILHFSLEHETRPFSFYFCFAEIRGTYSISFPPNVRAWSNSPEDVWNKCRTIEIKDAFSSVTENITIIISTGKDSSISLCEIEFYDKEDARCDHPPINSVINGQLEISQSKAVLHCKQGFEERNGRKIYAICAYNTWSYMNLQCVESEPQKEHKVLACPPPDFPKNGKYEPKKSEYAKGDKIKYSCEGRTIMFTEIVWLDRGATMTCLSNGQWSQPTPFCDTPAKLKDLNVTSKAFLTAVLDGDSRTCSSTQNVTKEVLEFSLDRESEVYLGLVCWKKVVPGKKFIKFLRFQYETARLPDFYCAVASEFHNPPATKLVNVELMSVNASPIPLCTIEFYAKDDEWCENPPEISVPNGQLEVNRSKAILYCNGGFKEQEGRELYATCRNNIWSYQNLQCVDELCEKPPREISVPYGHLEVSRNKAILICDKGFKEILGRKVYATCIRNTWSYQTLICIEIFCDPLMSNMSSSEGEWEDEGSFTQYTFGVKKTLRCKPGYHIEGKTSTMTCLEDGKWSDTSAFCEIDKFERKYDKLGLGVVWSVIIVFLFGLLLFCIHNEKARRIPVTHTAGKERTRSVEQSKVCSTTV